ncbi:SulP family inorganic anion transporter [Sphingomonas sp. So64.6b]|uniref:SulP family inorganic anion transporter n=1 Tax=Sphingomonas sp. So64.6b TaxID=2997354 RepID=UPI0016034CF8|nr:SulP family inorganic anion transporter [Sphingomonas sp. So64.6b]QNA85037.1 SulP family inorganic anion transporter [Sphingomonas sp. So64.6b]
MRRADIIAGLSVAGLMLPEAVAYAGIAGLAPQHAILAAIVGALTYAAIGRSRFAIVSPTSSSAAIMAASLGTLTADPAVKIALATITVALVGITFLAASLARLGGLTGFVSRPVLRGFAFGLAITIILNQMPLVFGVTPQAGNVFGLVAGLLSDFGAWNGVSIATGAAALFLLLALRRLPSIPGAFIVLAAGIAASILFDLPGHGVATVGIIELSIAIPSLPHIPYPMLAGLAELVIPLVLILLAESWGTMRALALSHGDRIEPNRELAALGMANLASALVQGLPVGAGFSAGSASEAAGARTRAAGAIAATGLALLMLAGVRLVAHLPQPVLAAVVIAALSHALNPQPIVRLWRLGRDQYVAIGAAVGVLALGVLNGMLFAILLSIAALVRRLASPQLVRLGRLGSSQNFVDLARHPDATPIPGVAIWRPAEPLFFANAEAVLSLIASQQAADPTITTVVVSLEESFDVDSSAVDALIEFDARLRMNGARLLLARVRDTVRDLLMAAGAHDLVARSSYSVDDAVAGLSQETDR